MALAAQKQEVRTEVQRALKQLTTEQMAQESIAIAQRVIDSPFFQQAKQLAIYVHCARLREVDTTAILNNALHHTGARLYVPRVLDSDANMHFLHMDDISDLAPVPPFGILEPPITYKDGSFREDILDSQIPLDLVVMPGLAFNAAGQRLGRGGGYYDKFVDGVVRRAEEKGWDPPLLIALAYETQMIENVPVEDNDRDVDVIVRANETICCTEKGKMLWERT